MPYVGKKPADIIATAVETTTGTFSGDLTVDTNTLYVDLVNNRVGIGTVSPAKPLHIFNSGTSYVQISGNSRDLFLGQDAIGGAVFSTGAVPLYFSTDSTERMRIDSNGRVMIGTTTEGNSSADDLTVASTGQTGITIRSGTSSSGAIYFSDATSGNDEFRGYINYAQNTDALSFGTVSLERMRIDSSGNVGIGTDSPNISSVGKALTINTTSSAILELAQNGSRVANFYSDGTNASLTNNTNNALTFLTNNTEKMRITSGGNVGIGTTGPIELFEVHGDTPSIKLRDTSAYSAGTGPFISFQGNDSGGSIVNFADIQGLSLTSNNGVLAFSTRSGGTVAERVRITDVGRVGIGTTSPSGLLHLSANTATTTLPSIVFEDTGTTSTRLGSITNNNGDLVIAMTSSLTDLRSAITLLDNRSMTFTNSNVEVMRIDSSGNLLVGTTSINPADNNDASGSQLSSIGSIQTSVSNATPAIFNRGNDGGIVALLRAGVSVGTIGVNGSDNLYLAGGSGDTRGIYINNTGVHPASTGGAINDASNDLGNASSRWNNLYLSGGVYLGGTGSANQLDDYEEGTCTFTYTGSSGNPTVTYDGVTYGFYTKIGRKVFIEGRIRTDAFSGGSGLLQVSGLPFTVSNIDPDKNTSGGGIVSNDFASNQPHSTMAIAGTTSFYCVYGNYNVNNISDCQDGANKNQIQFSFFYMAI